MTLSPQDFVTKWQNTPLNERQSAHLHFLDVCRLVGHPEPPAVGVTETGQRFIFEQGVKKSSYAANPH